MSIDNEIIYFDDDIDWVKEFELVTDTKPKPKSKVKKKPRNNWIPPKRFTMLGMDADETETAIAVVLGGLFMFLFVGSLIGYMIWYFKQ